MGGGTAGSGLDLERWESVQDSEDSEVEHDGDEAVGAALSEAQVLRLMV